MAQFPHEQLYDNTDCIIYFLTVNQYNSHKFANS